VSISRFQIEDILSQNAFGAIFLAFDKQEAKKVLLQRFFPFGAEAEGLTGKEKAMYEDVVSKLKLFSHANFRGIIEGGCDSVDHIPFIVSENIEEELLSERIKRKFLNAKDGILLAESGLRLMCALEKQFGLGATWLNLNSVDIESTQAGFFRFCVNPFRLLGLKKNVSGVKALAITVEKAMGWPSRGNSNVLTMKLTNWLKMAKTQSLDCHQALTALVGKEKSQVVNPVRGLANSAKNDSVKLVSTNLVAKKSAEIADIKKPSKIVTEKKANKNLAIILISVITLSVIATGIFFAKKMKNAKPAVNEEFLVSGIEPGYYGYKPSQIKVLQGRAKKVQIYGKVVKTERGVTPTVYLLLENEGEQAYAGMRVSRSALAQEEEKLKLYIGKIVKITGYIESDKPPYGVILLFGNGEVTIIE
jgi:hypothetical protein